MACSTTSAQSSSRISAPSSPQALTADSLRKHTTAHRIPSKKHKVSRPVSRERTFLCQDKGYPRSRPKALLPIQKAYAGSGPSVHWRGDDRALFELDPAAKYNIRDYLLEQCKATTQKTNELTKPTGTKVIFVMRFNNDDAEQEALCVQTNAATLYGMYNFRNVHPSVKNAPAARKMFARSTNNAAPCRVPRLRGTMSLTGLMAGVNEEDFPLQDRELDSDSDSDGDQEEFAPPSCTTALTTIVEDGDDQEHAHGFVDVIYIGASKYCRDPGSANHPDCHGRYKASSYAHNIVDAELNFQESLIRAHSGHDSAAYYCNWRILKHDHGETMVHGQSSLRHAIASPEEGEKESRSDAELRHATEQLLDLIEKKFGPLTLEGQKAKPAEPATNCSAECIAKVNEYLGQDPDEEHWLSGQSFDIENEDAVSGPGTLLEGVVDLSDDDDVHALTPTFTFAQAKHSVAPIMTEEELEKLINTPHEDFVNSYVQRYETNRIIASRAKHVREEPHQPSVSPGEAEVNLTVEPDTAVEQVIALPELIITAATSVSSLVKDVVVSTDLSTENHDPAFTAITRTLLMVPEAVVEQVAPLQPCDATALAPASVTIEAVAPKVIPVMVVHEVLSSETSARPESEHYMYCTWHVRSRSSGGEQARDSDRRGSDSFVIIYNATDNDIFPHFHGRPI